MGPRVSDIGLYQIKSNLLLLNFNRPTSRVSDCRGGAVGGRLTDCSAGHVTAFVWASATKFDDVVIADDQRRLRRARVGS